MGELNDRFAVGFGFECNRLIGGTFFRRCAFWTFVTHARIGATYRKCPRTNVVAETCVYFDKADWVKTMAQFVKLRRVSGHKFLRMKSGDTGAS